MPFPDPDPQLAAKLHRRWRGMGALLFMVFYSFFFSGHLELSKTTVVLKDDVVFEADTAAVLTDLTAPAEDAGARGTGEASSFLLLHRLPVKLLTALWATFEQDERTAKRHAVGTLQSITGALMVVFLYHLLLWSGLNTWNAVLFSAVLGCTTTALVFTAIPQTQIFSMLGLTAMLTAMARGKRARWWEFSTAAFYCVLCSHWNLIPVAILAVVRGVWRWRASNSYKPLPAVLGSVSLLVVFALGGMMLQSRLYPRSSQVDAFDVAKSSWSTLHQVRERASTTPWLMRTQDVFFTNIVAPTASMLDESNAAERKSRRTVTLLDEEWFVLDFRHAVWAGWLLLVLLGFTGLPAAAEHAGVATGALLVLGWQVLFYGALEEPGQRLLFSAAWTPAVVTLVAVGVGRALDKFKTLGVPVAVLLLAFVIAQGMRNWRFIHEIAGQLRVLPSL
ncbi:MAG: hypothetical protein JNG86_04260 [Verrucomicrobiaceae bacterium]|nr:hypothetical protein [Verrucomicrobiaceae bacterium]